MLYNIEKGKIMYANIKNETPSCIWLTSLNLPLMGHAIAKNIIVEKESQVNELKFLSERKFLSYTMSNNREEQVEDKKVVKKEIITTKKEIDIGIDAPTFEKIKKGKKGRPAGSPNKKNAKLEKKAKEAHDESPVVFDGLKARKVKAVRAEDRTDESDLHVEASLKAAEKMDKESKKRKRDDDPKFLDLSEEFGEEVNETSIVMSGDGKATKVKGLREVDKGLPDFVDKDTVIGEEDDDEYDDAFIDP
jgi:hypothetical protein